MLQFTVLQKCVLQPLSSKRLHVMRLLTSHLVLRVPKIYHISTHLASFHWLPTDSLIEYKLASLCYKLPQVFCSRLFDWTPEGLHTKPSATLFFWYFHSLSSLCVCMHLLGQRSFSCAAPSIWNNLPFKVRLSSTPASFKSSFKSHLFKLSYWLCVCVLCFVMGYVLQSADIVHKR